MNPISSIVPSLFGAERGKSSVIIPHVQPDADALGAAGALALLLRKKGHHVTVVVPTPWSETLHFLLVNVETICFEDNPEVASRILLQADFLFCVDWGTWKRAGRIGGLYDSIRAQKILIDHHQAPEEQTFDFGLVHSGGSSTCELVFDFIRTYAHDTLDADIASRLYAGIVSDTGSFRFASVTAELHQKVALLLSAGFAHAQVHERLYDVNTPVRLRFIGHILSKQLEVKYDGRAAVIWITKKDFSRFHIRVGGTEGLIHFPLSLHGVQLVAMFTDVVEGQVKCSFRSKSASIDVNLFARTYFSGGGHKMAAGGLSQGSLSSAMSDYWQAVHTEGFFS